MYGTNIFLNKHFIGREELQNKLRLLWESNFTVDCEMTNPLAAVGGD